MGALYRPTYTDRKGRTRAARVYWMRYMVRGRQVRESTQTTDKAAALQQLKIREGEVARGKLTAPDADRVTFSEMAEAVKRDYAMNDKDAATLGFRLAALEPFFGRLRMQRITPDDIDGSLEQIGYELKERDIVLIHAGAGAYNTEERYRTDHCGMTAEATRHLIAQGVRMMGIDAITFDPPVWAMFEGKHFWEAHLVMMDEDYWHLENLTNLDALPPHGFKLCVFPVKWMGTTAAPVRAVAIVDE